MGELYGENGPVESKRGVRREHKYNVGSDDMKGDRVGPYYDTSGSAGRCHGGAVGWGVGGIMRVAETTVHHLTCPHVTHSDS